MYYVIITVSIILLIAGFIGCIVPVIPGPPIAYISLILLKFTDKSGQISMTLLIVLAILNIIVLVIDYVLPIFGVKMFGASKFGIWGSIIGMLVGLIFFPPFGMIVGILIGAITGELYAGKNKSDALKIGMVSLITTVGVMGLKLILTSIITFYFIKFIS